MKLAFLILVHERPEQLAHLVSALDGLGTCFVHVDGSVSLEVFQRVVPVSSVIYTAEQCNVRWAGFEMVRATLGLMRTAMSHDNFDYLFLLSGSDYPIKPDAQIRATLSGGGEFLQLVPMPHLGHPMSRLDNFFFAPKRRSSLFFRIFNALLKLLPKRRWRDTVFNGMAPISGSSWWALSHDCAQYVLSFVDDHPQFVKFFKRTRSPDEMFFQIIVGGSPFAAHAKPSMTFADWSRPQPPWPATLGSSDIDLLRSRPELFARKFDIGRDPGILQRIEEEIRK